jgi:hypothetical protein
MEGLLNSDSHYKTGTLWLQIYRTSWVEQPTKPTEVNNENLYLARCSVADFRRLHALRIQTLDIHGDRGALQAPVQRRTNKRAGGADILTGQTSRKAVRELGPKRVECMSWCRFPVS